MRKPYDRQRWKSAVGMWCTRTLIHMHAPKNSSLSLFASLPCRCFTLRTQCAFVGFVCVDSLVRCAKESLCQTFALPAHSVRHQEVITRGWWTQMAVLMTILRCDFGFSLFLIQFHGKNVSVSQVFSDVWRKNTKNITLNSINWRKFFQF